MDMVSSWGPEACRDVEALARLARLPGGWSSMVDDNDVCRDSMSDDCTEPLRMEWGHRSLRISKVLRLATQRL
jgi:hypothetical protein